MADEALRQNIRAVLQSSKSAVPLGRLQHDFKMLMGHGIPIGELGFNSLDAFLRSIPDVVSITRNYSGELVCEAVSSRQTEHLAQLVKCQRGSKRASFTKGNAQTRSKGYRYPSQARLVNNWSQQLPANPKLPTKVPLLPTPRVLPTPKTYEVPPRFERQNSGRTAKGLMTTPTSEKYLTLTQSTTPPTTPAHMNQNPPTPLLQNAQAAPPPVTLQPICTTSKQALASLVAAKGLGKVSYKTTCVEDRKRRTKHYISIVKFYNLSFRSYPEEKPSAEEAEEEAARVALEDLDSTCKGINNSELAISRTPCIARRIFEIVKGTPNGTFSDYVLTQYVEKFNERLPNNWVSLIADETILRVDWIDEQRSIIFPVKKIQNDDIEIHAVRGFSDSSDTSSPSPAGSVSNLPCQEPIPSSLTPLPDRKYWNAYVTIAESTSNLYIRLIGDEYSTRYDNLATEMELFYIYCNSTTRPALDDITVGDLFALKNEDCWHRVEVKEVLSGDRVKCYFVDHGDFGEFDTSVLWPLEPQFRYLPFQAINCKLAILDGLDDFSINMEFVECVVGKSLVAEIVSRDDMSIILFDTTTDNDININKLLSEKMLEGMDSPRLKAGIMYVEIGNVSISGDLFLRFPSSTLAVLEKYIEFAAKEGTAVAHLQQDKIYLLKMKGESFHYRAVNIAVANGVCDPDKFLFLLVDYGNMLYAHLSDVLQINSSFDILQRIPHQVLRCRLNNVPSSHTLEWSEKAVERLQNLAPKNTVLIAKLGVNTSSEMPLVHLFKRLEKTEELVSINETLDLDVALFSSRNSASAKVTTKLLKKTENLKLVEPVSEASPRKAVEASDSDSLVLAEFPVHLESTKPAQFENTIFPPIGEYIDIIVILVASPSNFMFCQYEEEEKYDQLFESMKHFYEINKTPATLQLKGSSDTEMFAIYHKNRWNRARLKSFFQDDSVSVYLIDSGEYTLVSVKDVQPLHETFRMLPAQAVRGKLAGVEPIHGDWDPEDSCRFKDLVDSKPLVALVVRHEESADGAKVVMRLCDTSAPNEDVYIHTVLIDEKRGLAV